MVGDASRHFARERASDRARRHEYLLFSKRIRQIFEFESERRGLRNGRHGSGCNRPERKSALEILAGTLPGHFVSLEELNT